MILLPDCYDNIIEIQTWNFKLTDEYNENLIGLLRNFFPLQNGCANRHKRLSFNTCKHGDERIRSLKRQSICFHIYDRKFGSFYIHSLSPVLFLIFFLVYFFLADGSLDFFKLLLPRGFVFSQRYRISESDVGPTANSPPQRIIN